mgnify:CR=1 FL=1
MFRGKIKVMISKTNKKVKDKNHKSNFSKNFKV